MTSIIKNMNQVQTYTFDFQNVGAITAYRVNNTACIQFEKTVHYALSSGTRVCTLPSDLVPKANFRAVMVDTSGTVIPLQFVGSAVYITKAVSANTVIATTITYLVS